MTGAAIVAWLAGIGLSLGWWEAYDRQVDEWPACSPLSTSGTDHWQIQMFVHPHCPCSRASVRELRQWLQHPGWKELGTRPQVIIWIVRPPEADVGWEQGELFTQIQRWDEVQVLVDPAGCEAQRWGVAVSGHVLVIDPQGQVRFRGGLTRGRGQEGNRIVSRHPAQVLSIRQHVPANPLSKEGEKRGDSSVAIVPVVAPVYGCPLWTPLRPSPVTETTPPTALVAPEQGMEAMTK